MKEKLAYDVQTFLNLRGSDVDAGELVDHLSDDMGWRFGKGKVPDVSSMPMTEEKKLSLEITIVLAQMNAEFTVAGVDYLAGELVRKGWAHQQDAPIPEGNVGGIEVGDG